MEDIFNTQDNQSIVERLNKLTPESQALWGKMTVAQMLVHCQKPIDVLTGRLQLKSGLLGFLFGKMAKNNFLKMRGFGKNAPTHPKFKITDNPDFQSEKELLVSMVEALGSLGTASIAIDRHPFFGPMTNEEWGSLMYLHLDHHLKQFGA